MRHIRQITVAKAAGTQTNNLNIDITAILGQMFSFVLDLVKLKGKGSTPAT